MHLGDAVKEERNSLNASCWAKEGMKFELVNHLKFLTSKSI